MDFNQTGIHGIGGGVGWGITSVEETYSNLSSLFPNRLATAYMAFTKHLSKVTRRQALSEEKVPRLYVTVTFCI